MDNTFIFNPSIGSLGIKDSIYERLTKAQAITSCLLANNDGEAELPYTCIYGAIWAVDSYLEELDCLFTKLDNIVFSI
jgi:hypothetical protein